MRPSVPSPDRICRSTASISLSVDVAAVETSAMAPADSRVRTKALSSSGVPPGPVVMSRTGSPSRLSDPMIATDSVVSTGRRSLRTSNWTSMADPAKSTAVTMPISLPLRRTTAPSLSPWMFSKRALSGYRCQK